MSDDNDRLDQLLDLAKMAEETLNPELEQYVFTNELGWTILQHPLVYQVPFMNNGLANRALAAKMQQLYKAKLNKDYHTVIWLHERPWRFHAMTQLFMVEEVSEDETLELIRDVWIDSENIWQHLDEWEELLRGHDLRNVLLDAEKARLAALPETVTIYRGATIELNEDGLSYTLDHDRAVWFAKRLARDDEERVVIVAEVQRDDILALFESRNEDEVLALPEDVHIKHYEEI